MYKYKTAYSLYWKVRVRITKEFRITVDSSNLLYRGRSLELEKEKFSNMLFTEDELCDFKIEKE